MFSSDLWPAYSIAGAVVLASAFFPPFLLTLCVLAALFIVGAKVLK